MAAKALVSERCSIATEHPLASRAGSDVMLAGGNAFDAAVAASFALSVLLPHLNGPGGDFFALFFEARSGKVRCLNGSGWAPSGLTVERLRSQRHLEMPRFGPMSAVIPGMVAGIEELHRAYGSMKFAGLLDSATRLAEEGFQIPPGLARALARSKTTLSLDALRAFGGTSSPRVGRTLRQPRLAESLRRVAAGGSGAFYRGGIAEEIRRVLEEGGVEVETGDFDLKPEWVEPLRMEYRDHEIFEVPPNSIGAASLLILRQFERQGTPPPPADSFERLHLLTEATKVAMAAKDEFIGDPRFVKFDLEAFLGSGRPNRPSSSILEGDTTYFAVADDQGNLLSCIQSLFHHFGSRVYLNGSGFFLNDRASSFKFDGPNAVAPRKRPAHTLSALLISKTRGEKPYLAMGASGGEHRPQLHSLFVSNVVDYAMDVEEALTYPRFLWNEKETVAERGYKVEERSVPGLRVVDYPAGLGVAQGIQLVSGGGKKAYCDVRGDGAPAGF